MASNNGAMVLLAEVAKVDVTKHKKPYATLRIEEPVGFTYTLFPVKGQRKAPGKIKGMVLGPVQITGAFIGSDSKIFVYNSTEIVQA